MATPQRSLDRLNEQDFANLDFYVNSIDLAIKAQNSQMYYEQQQNFINYISINAEMIH